jgi:sugar phosphate isomerase/epimerase
MILDRRSFVAGSAAAGAALLAPLGAVAAQRPTRKAVLNVCSQEGIIPGRTLAEKLDRMETWGFDGLEVQGGGLPERVEDIKKALSGRRIRLSAVCLGSLNGGIVSEVAERRPQAEEELKRVLTAAGELQSTGVIYVPAFNGQTKLTNQEIRQVLLERLPVLGDHAAKAGTRLLMEPLNRNEAYFLRQLADAASICRDCKSPGVCMMGDFYHMCLEETSDMGAFISAGPYLHHVHLASRRRNLPGQDDRDFTDGFRGLKAIGYQDFCSLECGVLGDREIELPRAVKFLRSQWSKA